MLEPCCHRFTAPEGGARLAATAAVQNTLVTECAAFISSRNLQEGAYAIRGPLSSGRKRSIRICQPEHVKPDAYELSILTDLQVAEAVTCSAEDQWGQVLETKEVLVCTSQVFRHILEQRVLSMEQVNILIIDSCHVIYTDEDLQYIMKVYKESPEDKRPRILAMTYPLFNMTKKDLEKPIEDTEDDNLNQDNTQNIHDSDKSIENLEILDNSSRNLENSSRNLDNSSQNLENCSDDLESPTDSTKTIDNVEELGLYENLDDFEMYEKLEWRIDDMEKRLCCKMDLAEDIDGCKRILGPVAKPKELIIEYASRLTDEQLPSDYRELESFMRSQVDSTVQFLNDHRHDPTEIYGEDLYEELKNIPDPAVEPKQTFKEFLYVLDELGPYAADKAAFHLLIKLEKSKIKVPYERHFLLLRLCTTVFIKIRCYTEMVFSRYQTDWEKIQIFSTPKLLRFIEILQKFSPPEQKESNNTDLQNSKENVAENLATDTQNESSDVHCSKTHEVYEKIDENFSKSDANVSKSDDQFSKSDDQFSKSDVNCGKSDVNCSKSDENDSKSDAQGDQSSNKDTSESTKLNVNKMLQDIDKCDFTALGDKLEDRLNSFQANLKDLDADVVETKIEKDEINPPDPRAPRSGRRWARTRGRVRAARAQPPAPHALCGIVFMQHALMAKILFMVCVDLSRCVPGLGYVRCQYCCEAAPDSDGTKEAAKQGKRHEEVLKKFRMHECNLLLTTSVLEEGIDLPRCNLVLRWDLPVSYRSYGLCRGRARAPRAAAAVLCGHTEHTTDMMLDNVATYTELDQLITRKCGCGIQDEPTAEEEAYADLFTPYIKPYTPLENAQTNAQCNCTKETKNAENLAKKNKNQAKKDVEETVDNQPETIDDQSETIDNRVESMETKSSLERNIPNSNQKVSNHVPKTFENDSNLLFVSKHLDEVSKSIENVSETIENMSETIENMSETIENMALENLDSDASKIDSSPENRFSEEILSENLKNFKISDKVTKCVCGNIIEGKKESEVASVDLSNAIALINRYCAKLPSDTFTRLAATWWLERVHLPRHSYVCTLRLPLNCPLKYHVVGHPMPTRVLARRMVALQACRILHKAGELDDQLMPIGKENFKAAELEANSAFNSAGNIERDNDDSARPGTTKRRQYYYKRTASAFVDCQPVVDTSDSEIDPKTECIDSTENDTKFEDNKAEISGKVKAGDSAKSSFMDSSQTEPVLEGNKGESSKEKKSQDDAKSKCMDSCKNEPKVEDNNDESSKEKKSESGNEQQNKDSEKNSSKTDGKRNYLYAIACTLWCALPERYNTRGRRLHAPQRASQALGILMARHHPTNLQIPAFPVYTRSGEVRVCVELVPDADTRVSPRRGRLVRRFMRFVFTEVLRVRRRGMRLQSEGATMNNYYIVPTIKTVKDGVTKIDIDWSFLELIYQHTEEKKLSDVEKPLLWYQDEEEYSAGDITEKKKNVDTENESATLENPLLKKGETFVFDVDKYKEAVVTPWYRNRDQPQFFLVAEICWNLTPDSEFPSSSHDSFRTYYLSKYKVTLTQPNQPLLDVDHTSARLNLLTPRYVNRKGVALPVSSERTRRAKRDRLDQKQILVPELCRVHPFAAPLWFATVALPCVAYRINALLIADEIRVSVAAEVGVGIPRVNVPGFQWPPLDFGWSLAEVLNADAEKNDKKKEEDKEKEKELKDIELREKELQEKSQEETELENKADPEAEKTINDILAEKMNAEQDESGFEIGTWSNDMASSIPDTMEYDEMMEPLPPNLTFCTSASGGVNWCDPIQKPKPDYKSNRVYSVADSDCSYISSDFDTDDSDLEQENSDDDTDTSGFCSSKTSNNAVGVRIEYKTAHEAEAVDVRGAERASAAPARAPASLARGARQLAALVRCGQPDATFVEKFRKSVENHKSEIISNGSLIKKDAAIAELLPEIETKNNKNVPLPPIEDKIISLFPEKSELKIVDGQITLESIERNKRVLLSNLKSTLTDEEIKKLNCFSMIDVDIDSPDYVNEKIANVGFDSKEKYEEKLKNFKTREFSPYYNDNRGLNGKEFDFDYQPDLEGHPGPSPSVILQALTMSNANDGINLERLETIGDSFLKFAITAYLYCAHPTVHEGKLSHMRSKQVSNLNLYRLGRNARLGARMIAAKFEPHDNWLPPCHCAPPDPPDIRAECRDGKAPESQDAVTGCYIPYNLITQHSIPDKSIADCVEALIGAYLLECGPRGALLFMCWLGINVLPAHTLTLPASVYDKLDGKPPPSPKRQRTDSASSSSSAVEGEWQEWEEECEYIAPVGARRPTRDADGNWTQIVYGELKAPPSPLLRYIADPEGELEQMLSGYDALERTLQYRFKDRSLLLQALTHASHHRNRLTDCYQRLEFLGDAILDYLITRHLYGDARRHCPGALTDLRSALVNNTIFATLAVRHGFHKYFRHMSPGLNEVLTKYVRIQEENGHSISEEHYLIQEDELEQAEDVEVPKALGDLFESVAGAIFLDSGMSLGAVWQSYVRLMGAELEAFSAAAPKSPVRELLEAEPDTAKFGKPERLADGRRVRVCVEVFGRGTFKGIGRNYRIAKGTAARCALRHLKGHRR